jgi:hypothetical protein
MIMEECILTYTPRIDNFLREGCTLIMIAEVTFLTPCDQKHRRRHIRKDSPVSPRNQISVFKADMEEMNDYAGICGRILVYPPKKRI